jgi:hypothetical protein
MLKDKHDALYGIIPIENIILKYQKMSTETLLLIWDQINSRSRHTTNPIIQVLLKSLQENIC